MQKENLFFFSFTNESTFFKGTDKWAKYKIKPFLFLFPNGSTFFKGSVFFLKMMWYFKIFRIFAPTYIK